MNILWEIADSNFFQTFILIITVIVTIWIYFHQKKAERKDAARIVVMQINNVDLRAEQLARAIGNDTSTFDVDRLWK